MEAFESPYFIPASSHFLINSWYFGSNGSFAYKQILSMSRWWDTRFNNALVFPDLEPLIISFLHRWSGIYGQLGLYFVWFSCVISSKLIILVCCKDSIAQKCLLSLFINECLGWRRNKRSLKELPIYKTSVEKPYTKRLNNIYMLCELPFYNELSIVKTSKALGILTQL